VVWLAVAEFLVRAGLGAASQVAHVIFGWAVVKFIAHTAVDGGRAIYAPGCATERAVVRATAPADAHACGCPRKVYALAV
jgi:hypothetical protein